MQRSPIRLPAIIMEVTMENGMDVRNRGWFYSQEYSIAHNVLWNINTTRYKYYQNIYEYAKTSRKIDRSELIDMGKEAGFTHNMCLDEIIGCLYANFLTKYFGEEDVYWITGRALCDFMIYKEDVKYKFCELPLTIDFKGTYIRLLTQPVDSMSAEIVAQLQQRGWSRNKSRITLIKKVKDLEGLALELRAAVPLVCKADKMFDRSFLEVLEECGRKRKYLQDYTGNFNHRGNYASKTYLKYRLYYETLLMKVGKPIDWGGQAFDFAEIEQLNIQEASGFLEDSFQDGMIRELSKKEKEKFHKPFTLTGHAYSIITSYLNNYHNGRLSIIARPEEKAKERYRLVVGNNTLYNDKMVSCLKQMKNFDKGWFVFDELELHGLVNHVLQLCECFDMFGDKTIFDDINNKLR